MKPKRDIAPGGTRGGGRRQVESTTRDRPGSFAGGRGGRRQVKPTTRDRPGSSRRGGGVR